MHLVCPDLIVAHERYDREDEAQARQLLSVSRQIHREARAIYYEENTFEFYAGHSQHDLIQDDALLPWLAAVRKMRPLPQIKPIVIKAPVLAGSEHPGELYMAKCDKCEWNVNVDLRLSAVSTESQDGCCRTKEGWKVLLEEIQLMLSLHWHGLAAATSQQRFFVKRLSEVFCSHMDLVPGAEFEVRPYDLSDDGFDDYHERLAERAERYCKYKDEDDDPI